MPSWKLSSEFPPDPALAALLSDPRLTLRPPPAHVPVTTFRERANGFLSRADRAEIHSVEDLAADGPAGPIPIRIYRSSADRPLPVILFLHGGGFIFGDLETHDGLCRRLALQSGIAVVAVDYRLAPEDPYPAALDDAVAALLWVRANADHLGLDADRMAIGGDSAGGQLAIAASLCVTPDAPPLRHLALLYPLIDPACASESMAALGQEYMLTRAFLEWSWAAYRGSAAATDPLLDVRSADLSGLPAATIITAGYDPLLDEGRNFAARLAAVGVPVSTQHFPGMIHGFAGLPMKLEAADRAIAILAQAVREAMEQPDGEPEA